MLIFKFIGHNSFNISQESTLLELEELQSVQYYVARGSFIIPFELKTEVLIRHAEGNSVKLRNILKVIMQLLPCCSTGADIDTLCVAPLHIERSDFFKSFLEIMKGLPETKDIRVRREQHMLLQ